MKDLVSVIIPIYNVEKYLARCFDSVLNQTYSSIEIIAVDDGATDNSGTILDEYAKKDSRIKAIHTENNGVSIARKIGIENANGKYIMFVDSDDWLDTRIIESLYNLITSDDYQIAHCSYQVVTNEADAKADSESEKTKVLNFDGIMTNLGSDSLWSLWANLYKKELFENSERLTFDLAIGEDLALNYYIFKQVDKMIVTNRKYYYYFRHPGAISYQKLNDRFVNDSLSAYRLIEKDFDKCSSAYPYYIANVIQKDFEFLMKIVKQDACKDSFNEIRKEILGYKKYVFMPQSKAVLNIKHKISTILLMISPSLFKLSLKILK